MGQSDEDGNGPRQIVLRRETSTKAIYGHHIRKEGEFQLQGYIPKNNHTIGKRIMVGSFIYQWVVASSWPTSKPSQYQCSSLMGFGYHDDSFELLVEQQ